MLIVVIILSSALILDYCLGETRYLHPLVGFGNIASFIERKLNRKNDSNKFKKIAGILSWCVLVLPVPIVYYLLHQQTFYFYLFDLFILYFAIGLKSLKQHALNVYQPLMKGELDNARVAVGMIVSRQTGQLSERDISRATAESVLENGHDAVIASLFWFAIGGAPLVLVHRLANTLDAMWGYKSERFLHFGWFAAKADDLIGWPSAKVSALCYLLSQSMNPKKVFCLLKNATSQASSYKSLNGGLVMAAGAWVLNIRLGGAAIYNNEISHSATLGNGKLADRRDIKRSAQLVERASWFFVFLLLAILLVQEGYRVWR